MNRRDYLRATLGVAGTASLAGCTGLFETRSARAPPLVENRPDAVYFPTHVEGMEMVGMAKRGRYRLGLMYSYPHRFWTITGRSTNKAEISGDAHLMASIWDAETKAVLPTANVSVELLKGGETVDSRSLWPMLSQNMGYHFGDNVSLSGDGTYTARLDVGAVQARRSGAFADAFGERTTIETTFEYSQSAKEELMFERLGDKEGTEGAVAPMEMQMPVARLPAAADLPGRVLGEATSGDAAFVAFVPDEPPAFVPDDRTYLAVSPRTPHNRYPLPFMSLSGALSRGGSAAFEGRLEPAVDPALGYHYGAAVSGVESGDSLTVTVDAPPQIARHEGYETAFVEMPEMELTVS